jgi:ribosomal protein S18 acetylase RimI-like enzyme
MAADAKSLGEGLAAIDPWARAGRTAEQMAAFIGRFEEGARRYRITCAGERAGVMVVRSPWLHGPYLHLIGLLPEYQGHGVGEVALGWLEAEARLGQFRNLWLCVSDFNTRARSLYERQGFAVAGHLDGLVLDGLNEFLMRKKLF